MSHQRSAENSSPAFVNVSRGKNVHNEKDWFKYRTLSKLRDECCRTEEENVIELNKMESFRHFKQPAPALNSPGQNVKSPFINEN